MPGLFDLIFDDIFSILYIFLNFVLFLSQLNTFSASLTLKNIQLTKVSTIGIPNDLRRCFKQIKFIGSILLFVFKSLFEQTGGC